MKLLTDYRISRSRLTDAEEAERPWIAIELGWDAYAEASSRQRKALFKRLTPGQRAFIALNGLEAEVNNGGIYQYLSNSTGDLLEEALAGLKLIGAVKHLRLLQKALELFSDPAVLKNRNLRQKQLRLVGEPRLARIFDDPFFALEAGKRTGLQTFRIAYLKRQIDQFVLPPGVSEQTTHAVILKQEYRVPEKVARLRGEKLQRAVAREFWDLYLQAERGSHEDFMSFVNTLTRGQRALAPL